MSILVICVKRKICKDKLNIIISYLKLEIFMLDDKGVRVFVKQKINMNGYKLSVHNLMKKSV